MLGWTMKDLARESDVSFSTIRRAEDDDEGSTITKANMNAIAAALEAAGIEFIEADDGSPGIIVRARRDV